MPVHGKTSSAAATQSRSHQDGTSDTRVPDGPGSSADRRECLTPEPERSKLRQQLESSPKLSKAYRDAAVHCTHMSRVTVHALCGGVSGVASGLVTCPLDVIKTKLQNQNSYTPGIARDRNRVYRGLIGTARAILQEDGFKGLYRGLGPMTLGYIPTWAVYLTIYDSSKVYYNERLENKLLAQMSAAVSAGACSTLVTNPIWVIKTRLMSQVSGRQAGRPGNYMPWYYRSSWDAAKKMYRNEGFRSFYSGLGPALLGLSHVAIQFPVYERLKLKFTGLELGENSAEKGSIQWVGVSAATFISKVCATTATYPHEVLRTRLQTQRRSLPDQSPEGISFRGGVAAGADHASGAAAASSDGMRNVTLRYRGVVRTFKTILAEEGWRAFYNGMGTNLVRAVPAAMTTMLTYEFMMKTIHSMGDDGKLILQEERGWT